MKLHKSLKHAFNMVLNSKLRSWLTIIGIVIGIASVIAIISIGDGMKASVNDQIADLATDIITISPGYSSALGFGPGKMRDDRRSSSSNEPLTDKDVQALKGVKQVDLINIIVSGNVDVYYMGSEGSLSITGVDQTVWSDFITDDLESGRYLDSADNNVIVIGNSLAKSYFEDKVEINKVIQIEGLSYRVVGILEEGTRNDIYMPINSAYNVLKDSIRGEYNSITVKLEDDAVLNESIAAIEKKLEISRHAIGDDKDFTVSDPTQMASMASDMTSTISTFLTAIATISLLVGAIGIANTMFTSVLEKTKQIGILKAIGAENKDIMIMFIFNSAIIGLIGGLLGLGVGMFLSKLGGLALGLDAVIGVKIVLIAILISISVGLIAGMIPAYQASKLKPVDALRYE